MYQPKTGPSIVHIPTSPGCNNRCEFCMDEAKGMGSFTLAQHVAQLEQGRKLADVVTFTNGEPTLCAHLPQAASAAQDLGYRIIGVVTNGRRLAQRDYVESLISAGMNEFTVSAHGPSAEIHDAITGRRGSFEQTRRGLEHLAALRRKHRFDLRMNCTVVVKNLPQLRAMADYGASFGVDIVNFNVVEARGTALRDPHGTVPRYVDVVRVARESGLDFNRPTLSLSRVPPCAGGLSWCQDEFLLVPDGQVRRYQPQEGKCKGPPCEHCALSAGCPGIWEGYAQVFGWDELTPVQAPHHRPLRVTVGARCLNHCAHCPGSPSTDVTAQLSDGWLAGHRRVVLAGGDPFLDAALPQHIHACRDAGFAHIAVETNGRVLSKPAFAEAVVRLGLDEVIVHVHGSTAAQADEVAGVPGAFRQALTGLIALERRGQAWSISAQGPHKDQGHRIQARLSKLVRQRS